MVGITPKASEVLKDKLIKSCFQAGIGFRVLPKETKSERTVFTLEPDKAKDGDQTLEMNELKVFIDATSASQIGDSELDYRDGPEGGFYLRRCRQEGMDTTNSGNGLSRWFELKSNP